MRSVDFKKVCEDVPLTWFFENVLHAEAKPTAGQLRYHCCPSCDISKDQNGKVVVTDRTWHCFKCGKRGDVVEAAAQYWGKSLKDAAIELSKNDQQVLVAYKAPKPLPVVVRDDGALEEAISRLVARSQAARVASPAALNYFRGRGIKEKVVNAAVERGMLVTLPHVIEDCKQYLIDVCGRKLLADAGIWREDSKAPPAAFRPLMFVSHKNTAAEFRVMRLAEKGEAKSMRKGGIRPWVWVNGEEQDRIMLTEGGIDLLSALALGTTRSLMGLPGCENWRPDWFTKLEGRDVLTALDADGAGAVATGKILEELVRIKANSSQYTLPADAKDLNEELILRDRYVRLEFFEKASDPEPVRPALLSCPGCDTWVPAMFGKIKGWHIVVRPGTGRKHRPDDASLDRLVKIFEWGGATFSVDPPQPAQG